MSEQENIAALRAELRLFCQLMLASDDAADRMMQQIDRRALGCHDEQENWPARRVRLFRIAADVCGAGPEGHTRPCSGPGDGIGDE